MIDSRSKKDLRSDFALVCDEFDARMLKRGYKVAYSSTLRDDEKQADLYASGRTKPGNIVTYSKVTTFHGVGLAADIYQNAPTFKEQWQDAGFWATAKEVRKELGFTELSFETAHMQWDDHGKFSGTDVRSGRLPPPMPLYKGDDFDMYIEDIAKKAGTTPAKVVDALAAYVQHANTVEDKWEDDAVQKLKRDGIISSDHPGNAPVFWGEFAVVVDKIKK